jgi:hypothetical protein
MNPEKATREPSAKSPFAGCAIFIAAVGMMIFLIGFSVYALFRQSSEIEKFTATQAAPVEIAVPSAQPQALAELLARLEKFQGELATDSPTSLALSAAEINLAIAHFPTFKELKGTFYVEKIEAETLQIEISFPLNGRPRFARDKEPGWIASDNRFLNGRLIARPTLLKNEVVLKLDTINVPGKTVIHEFIDQMSPYRITERYLNDPLLAPAMAKLSSVTISNGTVIFNRDPKTTPADKITAEQVDSGSKRLFLTLGLAATGFLIFAGIILFVGLHKKAKLSPAPIQPD